MRISGSSLTFEQHLLVGCFDALRVIVWQNGGGKGPKPESILAKLTEKEEKSDDIIAFDSPEAFMRAYTSIRES